MSFQEVRSEIAICNKALARIHQQPLAGSLLDPANQNKLAGRECARWYKSVVRKLLEQHHFGIATKRVELVEKTNTRSVEWAAAYAKPSDMAFPVAISPYLGASSVNYYTGIGYLLGSLYGRPLFRYEGSTIYALQGDAELDYVSYNITEHDFTQTFEDLVVIFLASQLAISIAKDRDMMDAYKEEGMNELNKAIAHELNLTGQRYGNFVSEGELTRGSIVHDALMGWRY